MSVDQQVFDLFTVIDNLMKTNNELQIQTQQLLQQNNSLLAAILQKTTILEAPQLTDLNIELQSISVPENIDIAPQFFIDLDANKAYRLVGTLYHTGFFDLAPLTTYDSGDLKFPTGLTFDLLRLINFKYVGFNIIEIPPAPTVPLSISVSYNKNKANLFSFYILPDSSERMTPDRSDQRYYFKPDDEYREIVINSGAFNTIRVYHEKHFGIYSSIEKEALKYYINTIKEIML